MKTIIFHFWIFVNVVLAALGSAAVTFGILELPLSYTVMIALFLAWAAGALWVWALRSSTRTRILGLLTCTLILSLILISLVQLHGAGQILVNTTDHLENFTQLCAVLRAQYPYFEQKKYDWEAACRRYQPLVQAAQTDSEYQELIVNLLVELGDAHTGLINPRPALQYSFGWTRLLSDSVVLVKPGKAASLAGLERGAIILAVNGIPTEQALDAIPLHLRSGSTPRQSRTWAAFHLLSTSEETITITYVNPGSKVQTVTLNWIEADAPVSESGPVIRSEILPSGWGLIRLPTFSRNTRHNLIAEFDQALKQVQTAQGLILDLRGNGGGDSQLAEKIAGRFFSRQFCYGQDRFRQRLPQRGWSLRLDYCVQPRGESIHLPLVMLIDSCNMSSAEQFITAFSESGRAFSLGEPTGGASGNPLTFPLPGGGKIRFSTAAFYTHSGMLLEGSGIQPDLFIPFTAADFQQNRDPVLLAAQQLDPELLFQQQSKIFSEEHKMSYVKLFGFFLAFAALFTSIAIAVMGARWQKVEQSAYAGKRRPWWFIAGSILLIGLYLIALYQFVNAVPKNWAGWLLMVILPIGWGLKAALVILNPKGRAAVSSIAGDENWQKVALARLPAAVLLGVLAWFA